MGRAVALLDSWRFWAGVAYLVLALIVVRSYQRADSAESSANHATLLTVAVAETAAAAVYESCIAVRELEIHVAQRHLFPVVTEAECARRRDAILAVAG